MEPPGVDGPASLDGGPRKFVHENLVVYHRSQEFLTVAQRIIGSFPPGSSYLADQVFRAATSICLNIAEGAGEFSGRDKARFYRIALRSATEAAAVLDVCSRSGIVQERDYKEARAVLLQVVAMLTRLARNVGDRTGRA